MIKFYYFHLCYSYCGMCIMSFVKRAYCTKHTGKMEQCVKNQCLSRSIQTFHV